jgi:hypothetical protein
LDKYFSEEKSVEAKKGGQDSPFPSSITIAKLLLGGHVT